MIEEKDKRQHKKKRRAPKAYSELDAKRKETEVATNKIKGRT